jgi:hypothetical protein
MTTDTSRTIEIEGSPAKLLLLGALGVLMTALAAVIAFDIVPDVDPVTRILGGWLGFVFFGLCTVMILWRALTTRGAVVTIAPHGIRDIRVAAEFIPWTAVQGISTWEYQRQRVLVVRIDPEVEKRLTLTRIARWSRAPNRALGADGLAITASGLKIDYPTLLQTSLDYSGAYGSPA